ncbi:MAG: hypothetical protein V1777_04450 [Candidatus Micrarchaeota archaeon]
MDTKTEKKAKRIRLAIFLMWAFIALWGSVVYSEIPLGSAWDNLNAALEKQGMIGQQIVFEPDYLRFFALDAHMGRFTSFDARPNANPDESLYETYWKVAFCGTVFSSSQEIKVGTICAYRTSFLQFKKKVFLLSEHLKEFEVFTLQNKEKKTCPFFGNAFICGSNYWEKITTVYSPIEYKKMLCVFSHPFSDKTLVLKYSKPVKGTLFFGFLDDAASQNPAGKPAFRINGNQTVVLSADKQSAEIAIDVQQLEIEVTTDNVTFNHVCFNASLKNEPN